MNVPITRPDTGAPEQPGPERTLLRVHASAYRSRGWTFLLVSSLLLLGGIGGIVALGSGQTELAIAGAALTLACFVTLAIWKIHALGERLTITSKRVIHTHGLLTRRTLELAYRHVEEIEIVQTLTQRLWGIGDLTICGANDGDEIHAHHLPRPGQIRDLINRQRGI